MVIDGVIDGVADGVGLGGGPNTILKHKLDGSSPNSISKSKSQFGGNTFTMILAVLLIRGVQYEPVTRKV
jgi:hypothetical protein